MKRAAGSLLALLLLSGLAHAADSKAVFALIIGANESVDALPALRYADDDAARYLDLFRSLGAKAYLLTRPDENTARVHPQALAEAHLPRKQELEQTVARLAAELQLAHERHVDTVLYFIYAGHGNVHEGRGYITLEDARLSGADLESLVERIGADQSHVIIDACFSYYLAFERGPGGRRRQQSSGFAQLDGLGRKPSVGLLLSTSSARESHEWEGFQSGIFSYEVRAGLYGAADADGDGQVSYREIAAFVTRANAAMVNERFRPDVFARPPESGPPLVDLRGALGRRVDISAELHGHYLLEDSRGVRIAELNSGATQTVRLVRPGAGGALYLRRLDGEEREWVLPPLPDELSLAELSAAPPKVAMRGAAHEAFATIFSLPFDHDAVEATSLDQPALVRPAAQPNLRLGGTILAASGLAISVAGIACGVLAKQASDEVTRLDHANGVFDPNQEAAGRTYQTLEGVFIGIGAAAAVTGVVLYAVGRNRAHHGF